ncbi:hypothetical protein PMAYCL1PPCAC_19722 [Pristionchus mayeri]|uniref:Uncharacterized protein n=1 Tax=Pristionchus mayeri TaxID=1317129 RepID=A0AAN5I2G3_9BILA|nr:hypothetical protein PMAYCL1PPCAC_19722 [Pristionchus mayeri]
MRNQEELRDTWIEGVVTSVSEERIFITFKLGSSICPANMKTKLRLGDIVDIRVTPARSEGCFNIVQMGEEIRRREDLVVLPFEKTLCSIFCDAKVIDRSSGYLVLDTPIIGRAFIMLKDAPREMKVGDLWRVKMQRRKDKKDFPSHWMVTAVDKFLQSEPRRNVIMMENSSNSRSNENNDPTRFSYQDAEWTTVIITGSNNSTWYGNFALADGIRISKRLSGSGKELETGAFHRVKLTFGQNGWATATALNPNPIYPENFDVDVKHNQLKVWCYSTIVDSLDTAFITRNEILGDATLPLNNLNSQLRVGDQLETLYTRLSKLSGNMTNWMVRNARIKKPLDTTQDSEEQSEVKEEVYIELEEPADISPANKSEKKDRRVLDKMQYFLKFPEVRKVVQKNDPNNRIQRILEIDLSQMKL